MAQRKKSSGSLRGGLWPLLAAALLLGSLALIDPLSPPGFKGGTSAGAASSDIDADGTPNSAEFGGDSNFNGIPDVLDPLTPGVDAALMPEEESGIGWMGRLGLLMSFSAGVILLRRTDAYQRMWKYRITYVDPDAPTPVWSSD